MCYNEGMHHYNGNGGNSNYNRSTSPAQLKAVLHELADMNSQPKSIVELLRTYNSTLSSIQSVHEQGCQAACQDPSANLLSDTLSFTQNSLGTVFTYANRSVERLLTGQDLWMWNMHRNDARCGIFNLVKPSRYSSDNAALAAAAGIDIFIWNLHRSDANSGAFSLGKFLYYSSANAAKAAEAGIDIFRWSKHQQETRDSYRAPDLEWLLGYSSPNVAKAAGAVLSQRSERQSHADESYSRGMGGSAFQGAGGEYIGFSPDNDGADNNAKQPWTKEPQAPKVDPLETAKQIAQTAAAKDRSFAWLNNTDPAAVNRLINTVNTLRKNNPEITDRDIYLRYYRKASGTDPSKSLLTSYNILMALMGGDGLRGELPF